MSFLTCRAALMGSLALAMALPGIGHAQQPEKKKVEAVRSGPVEMTPVDRKERQSTAGNYLAARHASVERDAGAAASFYRSALRADPKNAELLDRAFISTLAGGDMEEAVKLAERIVQADKTNRVARLVLGVKALKQKQYAVAQKNINQSVRGPITDLVAALLSGWSAMGAGDMKGAAASIDKLAGPEWYPIFKDLHVGLMYDLANRPKEAGARLERAYKLDDSALRVVDSYGRWVSRNKSAEAASELYETFDKKLARHPLVLEGIRETKAGKKLPMLVTSPQQGAAEALYGIGASLTRRGAEDLALVYLQLALYLDPTHALAILSLGDLYESIKRPQLAIKVYERVPSNSLLKRNAQIQLATNLDTVERSEEGIKALKSLIDDNPKDIESIMALGNIERGKKKFAECAQTYSLGIDALPAVTEANWVLYYFRGICYERSKQWPKSEADLKKALELKPEQAHVLNYLGYSWIDQGVNLDEGMKMIRRAVEQRPDDGYIVDSLGWAYFRIGNFEEAVKHLERAIDLRPEDPTINDHLGDAYWKVGRKLEARFQWSHAKDLKPEPEEMPKIDAKLRDGLPEEKEPTAAANDVKKDDKGG